MDKPLTSLPIVHILKHKDLFEGLETHIIVAEKYIKLNFSHDSFSDVLEKLISKDVTHIYISEESFAKIIYDLQKRMGSSKFYDPMTTEELRVSTCDAALKLSRDYIKQFGVNKEVLEVIKDSNAKMQKILDQSPGIFAFVKRFKLNCSQEHLQISITNFIMAMAISKFPWKTNLIIQKSMMATLLCDITLNSQGFDEIREYEANGNELSENTRMHPMLASEILNRKRDLIPSETITIIEQHHERPDGKGFPNKITSSRFNQLSAIFIVCQRFVEALFDADFNAKKHHQIIENLQMVYQGGHFDKAMDALISVLDEQNPA
jgi:predicted CopG family antitoxin